MSAGTATSDNKATGRPGRPPVDWGRIVMVPLSVIFGAVAVLQLTALLSAGSDGGTGALVTAGVTGLLTALFYALIVSAYLRRGPASATTRVLAAVVAAPAATFLPFALPFTGSGQAPPELVVVGDLLLVAGLAWSAWSIRCLDRSLSVVAQARGLVDHGPYALVRHPLYLGEIVAMLGLALTLGGALPLLFWLVLVGLQGYRAVHEERLLGTSLPGYDAYRARTARIVPALF